MLSAGVIDLMGGVADTVMGAGEDLIGGAIGSLFEDDAPAEGYNKEYGEEARRMRYGQSIGQRIAMGDPTIEAYYKSLLRTNPGKVNDFLNDFGEDLKFPTDTDNPWENAISMGNNTGENKQWQDRRYATLDSLEKTFDRLSNPSDRGSGMGGYSFGNTQPDNLGGFSNQNNKFKTAGNFNSNMSLENKGAPLKVRSVGSGNKYAKMNQERKTGMFA